MPDTFTKMYKPQEGKTINNNSYFNNENLLNSIINLYLLCVTKQEKNENYFLRLKFDSM